MAALSLPLATAPACATLPPPDDPDVPGMLAAAVTGAMLHVKDLVPAGPIAIDTVNVGSRAMLKALATRFNFAVGDIRELIQCDRITGECLLRDAAGPAVVIMLRPPAAGYTDSALREFPFLEVDVHWRRGESTSRKLAGQVIDVRLEWTPQAGWRAFDSRTAWKLH
jgi:hypothetical protein